MSGRKSPLNNDLNSNLNDSLDFSLPSDPSPDMAGNNRNDGGDFAPDMSLQAYDVAADQGQRDARYQSLRGGSAYVPVTRPPSGVHNNSNASNASNATSSLGGSLHNSLISGTGSENVVAASSSSSSIRVKDGSGRNNRQQSPMFAGKAGTSSPISSIWSSGSKLLRQSMRVVNLEPGSLRASTFTVITAMVGGGTLTIPYGIKMAGTLTGLIYLILACLCGAYSTWALIFCAEKNNCRSYRKLAKKLYGQKMAYFIQFTLLILLWCCCISYMTLTKELLSLAIYIILDEKNVWEDNQYVLLIVSVVVIVLPLALMRKVSALRYASMIGFCVVTFTCVLVTVLYFEWCDDTCIGKHVTGENKDWVCEYHRKCFFESIKTRPIINPNFLEHTYTIAIMIGGFADHPTVLPIYFEMQRRSPLRMKKCLIYGFLIVFLLYLDIAYFGYFTFPRYVQQNLLSSDYAHNPVMLVTAACLCLYVVSVVPLFAHAFRKSVAELMIEMKNKRNNMLLNDAAKGSDLAPEARDVLEYPEDHIAFVPHASPRTQQTLRFGKVVIQNEGKRGKDAKKHGRDDRKEKDANEVESDDDTFESADSFEMERSDQKSDGNEVKPEAPRDPYQLDTKTHIAVTVSFVATALGVALFAPNVGTVNALIGSTTMPLCCFVFPAMCAWKTPQAPDTMKYGTIVLAVVVMISSAFQLAYQFYFSSH